MTVHAIGMAALPKAAPHKAAPLKAAPLKAAPLKAAARAPTPSPAPAPPPGTARARYLPLIAREAAGTGLPVAIADAVARIESGYDPTVIGSVGELGLMQVRPSTAAMLGFRGTDAELATPEINVRYGVRYLAQAWRLADGDLCRALMKYRAGHGSETISPLSQVYCARARAILGGTMVADASPDAPFGVRSTGSIARRRNAPASAAPATPPSFWEAHRARVAKLNARVLATWRARGWKSG